MGLQGSGGGRHKGRVLNNSSAVATMHFRQLRALLERIVFTTPTYQSTPGWDVSFIGQPDGLFVIHCLAQEQGGICPTTAESSLCSLWRYIYRDQNSVYDGAPISETVVIEMSLGTNWQQRVIDKIESWLEYKNGCPPWEAKG